MIRRARRVLVVANPAAGRRRRDAGEAAARAARSRGASCEIVRTRGPGDATRLGAEAARQGYDTVIAAGGDGTVHEVANGVAGTSAALGIAPSGTMNLLARVIRLPLDPARAAEIAVASGRVLRVRPGRAGNTLFVLMAGIGFDAWVLRRLVSDRNRKVAFRHYVAGALRSLGSYRFPAIRLDAGGERLTGTAAILGRAPLYGGFLRPTPRARLEAEDLELCVLQMRAWGAWLRLAPALWSGSHLGMAGVEIRPAVTLRAESDDPDVPVQLDGEVAGRLPMEFTVSDRVLTLVH